MSIILYNHEFLTYILAPLNKSTLFSLLIPIWEGILTKLGSTPPCHSEPKPGGPWYLASALADDQKLGKEKVKHNHHSQHNHIKSHGKMGRTCWLPGGLASTSTRHLGRRDPRASGREMWTWEDFSKDQVTSWGLSANISRPDNTIRYTESAASPYKTWLKEDSCDYEFSRCNTQNQMNVE